MIFLKSGVNVEKSEIMAFSKTVRVPNNKFRFNIGRTESEYVTQYKYLGVNFLKFNQIFSGRKTFKSESAVFYKTKHFDKGLKPSAVLYIFDILIIGIALWGGEIWTANKPYYEGKSLDDLFALSFKSHSEFDTRRG